MGRTGEADDVHLGVRTQVLRGLAALLHKGVNHARRNALICHQTSHHLGMDQRSLVRRLDDHGTPCSECWRQRADQQSHWGIPGHDDGGHPDGFALDVRIHIRLHFDDTPKQVACQPGVVAQFRNAGQDFAFGLALQLAIELHQGLHHLRLVLLQTVGKQPQHVRAQFGLLGPGGALKSSTGAGNRRIHFGQGGFHKMRGHLTGGRIDRVTPLVAVVALDPLAVDVVFCNLHGARLSVCGPAPPERGAMRVGFEHPAPLRHR